MNRKDLGSVHPKYPRQKGKFRLRMGGAISKQRRERWRRGTESTEVGGALE